MRVDGDGLMRGGSTANAQSMKSYKTAEGRSLEIRVGLHTGSLIGTVTGVEKMPHYSLIGDTVNTAARMETTGEPSKIHVSNATAMLLLVKTYPEDENEGENTPR